MNLIQLLALLGCYRFVVVGSGIQPAAELLGGDVHELFNEQFGFFHAIFIE